MSQAIPKRKPIMADRFLATPITGILVKKKDEEMLRDQLLQAKRFVLDDAGARYLGRMVCENPQMVAKNIEFAIPPFPKMYVELPFLPFYREVTNREPDWRSDTTWGMLVVGPKVYMVTEAASDPPVLMPWFYWLNRPWKLNEELAVADQIGLSRKQIDNFFWGEAFPKLRDEEQRSLRAYHSMWLLASEFMDSPIAKKLWANVYDTSAGDLRNLVALLLLLNRSGDYSYEEQVTPQRAMYKAKPRTFLAHSIVRFRMDPIKRVLGLTGIGGSWRREHDVKGHFCHDKTARAAHSIPSGACHRDEFGDYTHDWQEYGVNQWRCLKCGGLRWWRGYCRRGTRDKGKVKTIYEVTAKD